MGQPGGTPRRVPSAATERQAIPVSRPSARRIGDRLPPSAGPLRQRLHDHGLSIALFALFVFTMAGQAWTGWYEYNEDLRAHDQPAVSLGTYLGTGHFGEATFENWESEFLQMACYVLLTIYLYQLGSSESKRPDTLELVDLDPRDSLKKDKAPWPVRTGGVVLMLDENSLSLAFTILFFLPPSRFTRSPA
jgi:hypothetical protein